VADSNTTKGLIAGAAVLILYYLFILPWLEQRFPGEPIPPPDPPGVEATGPSDRAVTPRLGQTTPPAGVEHGEEPTTTPAAAAGAFEPLPPQPVRDDLVYETELFRVTLTNRGAGIRSVVLRDFFTFPQSGPVEGQGDLRLIHELEPGKLACTLAETTGLGNLDEAVWEFVEGVPVPEGYAAAAQFRTRLPERGLEITKTYLFVQPERDPASGRAIAGRDIRLEVQVKNLGTEDTAFRYRLRSVAGLVPEPVSPPRFPDDLERERAAIEARESRDIEAVIGGLTGSGVDLETFNPGKVKDGPFRYTNAKAPPIYAGVKGRYFAAVIAPLSTEREIVAVELNKVAEHNISADIEVSTRRLEPGATATQRYMLLVVPSIPEILADYPEELHVEDLMAYSWPAPITRGLSKLLRFFHRMVGNYGLAIILLTICVRIVLHPLTMKSQKSAFKMQKLQPLLKAAKEKHKSDKRAFQQEQMRIMREQGVNPLGGCLPMVLQFPIMISLWRALYQNAGLRHAPFMLWIKDLSQADNLFTFSEGLPLVGGMSFNLLPLLVAVLMVLSQKMLTPQTSDPQAQQQQKIMRLMPIIFCVMLYSMASGLMLYFACSTGFGVIEQYWIRRRLQVAAEAEPAEASLPVDAKRERQQKDTPQRRRKRRR